MASEGKSVHHQATVSAPERWALKRIFPHDQLSGSPRPRKERPASAITAREAVSTTDTTMIGATAGSRCRVMIQKCEPPMVRAAST